MEKIDWHRLFGVTVADLFSDLPFNVELEKDLSLRQQFLDVVVVRREPGEIGQELPDGLDNLADHNLITYKSMREALNNDAIVEFIAYMVSYRKQVGPSGNWLPLEDLSLYAICTRSPQNLAPAFSLKPLDAAKPGVYDLEVGHIPIRAIVLSEIRATDANRVWNIFSGRENLLRAAARTYRPKLSDTSTVLDRLFLFYRMEGLNMPYTIEEFYKETLPEFLAKIPPEERLKGMSPEDLVKSLSVEQLKQLKALLAQDTEKQTRDE